MTVGDVLFDALTSERLRDQGIGDVASHSGNFMSDGLVAVGMLHGEYTGEDIRRELLALGISPHHPNAWGALIRSAVKRNLLIETGAWVKAKSVKSHASRYPLYRTCK